MARIIFHGVRGMEAVSLLSEAKYITKNTQVSDAVHSKPVGGAPKLMTAKEMDDAMALDSHVCSSLSKLKRKLSF